MAEALARRLTSLARAGWAAAPLGEASGFLAHEWIDGVPCYRHFADAPERIGGVIICVSPADAVTVVRDASEAGIKRVWLQQGAESPYVAKLCAELGVDAVLGECILMHANPTGIHKVHRALDGVLGRLPR